ncbi:unnamed protein product [Cuscuta campestris]|uniref:Uncharacterized protein n=1 Tax=Cuscuta campestris TaxID=132261 RepID=A0A484KQN3_9ASTE|nr:unnamed protein product [Cuscuta campestris]
MDMLPCDCRFFVQCTDHQMSRHPPLRSIFVTSLHHQHSWRGIAVPFVGGRRAGPRGETLGQLSLFRFRLPPFVSSLSLLFIIEIESH